eukprot:GFYU01005288.1.p1 GENE.GFYU01005288.1~~GFYU01005288.1.p1  ORF type:complete len:370 (-),score=107.08 GFYU01005288.1:1088-2080(-)
MTSPAQWGSGDALEDTQFVAGSDSEPEVEKPVAVVKAPTGRPRELAGAEPSWKKRSAAEGPDAETTKSASKPAAAATSAAGNEKKGPKKKKQKKERQEPMSSEVKEKRNEKFQQIKAKKSAAVEEGRLAGLSAELFSEYFWKMYAKVWKGELTSVEVGDYAKAGYIVGAGNDDSALTHEDRNLSLYLKQLLPRWKTDLCHAGARKSTGSPTLLIVTHSAVRAVEVIKCLDVFKSHCKVGKLFAKHMKVDQQQHYLASEKLCIAVGTPSRLQQLCESGHLKLDATPMLLFDVRENMKRQTLLDMLTQDVMSFFKRCCLTHVKAGDMKISFF